ncbi:TetR/AcrR family transcriptional regulator [Niveispirillum sp. KHB5.9]|uniref:TetR/AcrR family transcriptional regulator n=1 Tax=Niveispirillum sp. KHB5.9 TaxID=3400269 RepID=UPI003A8BBE28
MSMVDEGQEAEPLLNPAGREPKQGRSRASFERMLAAATDLLIERGNDDFALTDVAKRGKVSIGSIYCRFDSKDDLIQAVQRRFMEKMAEEEAEMVARLAEKSTNLDRLVRDFVEELAEFLKRNAPVLRPMMLRASADPVVRAMGRRGYDDLVEKVMATLLSRRDEIGHELPELACEMTLRVAYSAIARYLGFGMTGDTGTKADWKNLKTEVGVMCSTYLRNGNR